MHLYFLILRKQIPNLPSKRIHSSFSDPKRAFPETKHNSDGGAGKQAGVYAAFNMAATTRRHIAALMLYQWLTSNGLFPTFLIRFFILYMPASHTTGRRYCLSQYSPEQIIWNVLGFTLSKYRQHYDDHTRCDHRLVGIGFRCP